MDLWIYDESIKLQGIIDTASSVIWADRFRQCGDFEIYMPASTAALELLQIDRYVVRPGSNMVGIVEKIQISTSGEDGDYITASGRDLRSILDRRIIWEQTVISGTVENAIRRLVTDAFISPTISARKFDLLSLGAAHGFTETVATQYTGDNLLEAVEALCAAYNYGFKITLQDGGMVFDVYKGADRSAMQSKLPRVIFSDEFDTLAGSEYTRNKADLKTVALVAGEGEGIDRKRVTVSLPTGQSGLQRREMFIDARDVSSNDGEITAEEYNAQLIDRGLPELYEAAEVESMTGSVELLQTYTCGKDYDLGDLVTVRNRYGVECDTQVLEIVESWDAKGYVCTPTFG